MARQCPIPSPTERARCCSPRLRQRGATTSVTLSGTKLQENPSGLINVNANVTTGTATVTTGTLVTTNSSVFSVTVGVTITPTANTKPLRAGSYSDVLRLTVMPQ